MLLFYTAQARTQFWEISYALCFGLGMQEVMQTSRNDDARAFVERAIDDGNSLTRALVGIDLRPGAFPLISQVAVPTMARLFPEVRRSARRIYPLRISIGRICIPGL